MGVFARRRDGATRDGATRDARRRDATRAMLAAARPNAIARCARAEARGPGRDASTRARRALGRRRRRRRDGGARAAAIEDDAAREDDDDDVASRVDAASEVLDKIIRETVEGIFLEEAATEVMNEASAASEREAVESAVDKRAVLRAVVRSHFEELDGSFLAALGAYVRASEASGDLQLVSLLNAIKEETLATVTDSLTDEMQVVQLVARLKSNEERFEVIRVAHAGGGRALGDVDVPGVSVEKVERAAAQLIDELELQEQIPNWDLLYQVIVVRETARQLSKAADASGVYSDVVVSGSFAPSELPKAESALIKELVVVNTVAQRRALLAQMFDETRDKLDQDFDRSSGKVKLKKTTRGFQPRVERAAATAAGLDSRDLRPGRFIDSVINLRVSLLREGEESTPVVTRLGEIYYEMCDVVMENANVG